jgi:hypothetical protein
MAQAPTPLAAPIELRADERTMRALDLAKTATTWAPVARGRYRIPSGTRPGTWHHASARACSCEDAARGNVCKHRLAVGIHECLIALLHDS